MIGAAKLLIKLDNKLFLILLMVGLKFDETTKSNRFGRKSLANSSVIHSLVSKYSHVLRWLYRKHVFLVLLLLRWKFNSEEWLTILQWNDNHTIIHILIKLLLPKPTQCRTSEIGVYCYPLYSMEFFAGKVSINSPNLVLPKLCCYMQNSSFFQKESRDQSVHSIKTSS